MGSLKRLVMRQHRSKTYTSATIAVICTRHATTASTVTPPWLALGLYVEDVSTMPHNEKLND